MADGHPLPRQTDDRQGVSQPDIQTPRVDWVRTVNDTKRLRH